jgi:preprotein translocase subunit YajC
LPIGGAAFSIPHSYFFKQQGENHMFLQTIAMAPSPGGNGGAAQSSPGFTIGWLVFMVAIFYFVMIRPQRRREKERKALIEAVKTGNRVLLTSGILGEVANVREKTLIIRIAEKTKIEVLKTAVAQVLEEKGDLPSEVQP